MPEVQTLLLAGLLTALIAAAATDIRSRTISNALNLGIALAAPLFWWATGLSPWPGAALQLAFALAVFGAFAGLFAIGAMGGGDVKLIGALALWFPVTPFLSLLTLMAILGGVLTVAMLLFHKLRPTDRPLEVPYGVAIAAAGAWSIVRTVF
ncbi:Prepilin peptidase [Sphingomonas antarctica]|uniref:A24 family peptidase n=1 Tax=Sphingomonas antarctica TaxID=2040274 RepID=UPI0039EC780E